MKALSLSELNGMVRQAIALTFPDEYWVVAEIAEMREASAGHCYLELVEKEEEGMDKGRRSRRNVLETAAGTFKARAKANIWCNVWYRLKTKFTRTTGRNLEPGMKILLKVQVTFHEQYGYSLNVADIDPDYTMGEMARRRQEILVQLEADGVLHLNRQIPLPRPLQRIAVISAAGAAGYGDFCHQLFDSGFRFAVHLFPATMQGAEVERSIIAALDHIAEEMEEWDCVTIIRGGGAVTDLNGFDTYLLAANIAQFPLPVLTGIGHDRDETIIDRVAHTHLKTPTAVAQFLIDNMQQELDGVETLETRIMEACQDYLSHQQRCFDAVARRFERSAFTFTHQQQVVLMRMANRIRINVQTLLQRLLQQHQRFPQRMRQGAEGCIGRQQQRLALAEKSLEMASPERILRLGFSITTNAKGHVVRSPEEVKTGETVRTMLEHGSIASVVTTTAEEEQLRLEASR